MSRSMLAAVAVLVVSLVTLIASIVEGQRQPVQSRDAVQEAQAPARGQPAPPAPDPKDPLAAPNAKPSSPAFADQPEKGKIEGFDFFRDPLNAKKPMQTFDEIMKADVADKPKVMATQKRLLEKRYDLTPKSDPNAKMSRGKPLPIGPKQVAGGQVFPQIQLRAFPRLERFDVEFDLPEAFLPEFPPAIFLQNRPELGDVSRGEVVSINNFYRLFKDLLTPVQLDGLRMLVTPFPQEEFNPTDDRKTAQPSLGVTCLDCHVNGHTTGQFHLSPDIRPQERRFRLDTTSLRGVNQQQIHGSKRSLRSVEDFTEFEQRTAYFNGDEIHAAKKGMNIISRVQVSHMAQMQNLFDFPPAPKLLPTGRLDQSKATESELRGEQVFFGKGQCASCHSGPAFLDHQMHDLKLERFLDEPGDGPIKTFTLRGIKDSPPYLHDGRLLTLEDTVEFFNLVLGTKLSRQEKADLVAYLRQL
jgi:cytochrome c peroxidase